VSNRPRLTATTLCAAAAAVSAAAGWATIRVTGTSDHTAIIGIVALLIAAITANRTIAAAGHTGWDRIIRHSILTRLCAWTGAALLTVTALH
jgi:hypothetical protein